MEQRESNSCHQKSNMTTPIKVTDDTLPGLYRSANNASLKAQKNYFTSLSVYLFLLTTAAAVSFYSNDFVAGAYASAFLFLATLGILVALKVMRPDDVWYNGRAVAESVKTRTWRWMMRAEPYEDFERVEAISKKFITDLRQILDQNRNLAKAINPNEGGTQPITKEMSQIRSFSVEERLEIYERERVRDQREWYSKKSTFNKSRALRLFWASIALHCIAIAMLLFRIEDPSLSFPVGVVATSAGAVLTWLQARKHNELTSSYSLAAHEIGLVGAEAMSIHTNKELSDFVINTEAAFSREHTQWVARKTS